MQSAHLRKSLQFSLFLRVLATFFLLILLTACGTNSTAGSTPAHAGSTTKTATSVPAKKPTSAPAANPLNPNGTHLNIQQGDLLIQSSDGFQCPDQMFLGGVAVPGTVTDQLVLASDKTSYSQAEIAQMRAYYQETNFVFPNAGTPSPPPTLRWVLGGSVDEIPMEPSLPSASFCQAVVTVTNTGNTLIQIPKVGVQLNTSPQQNTYQYRLINVCSFMPPAQATSSGVCPPPLGLGAGGSCNAYDASIQLSLGEPNTVFSAVPRATPPLGGGGACGTLTLAPAAQDTLTFDFSFAPNTPGNLIYSIVPVFTVDTTQGEQTLALSQLASTLTFASASQFSCYTLQGTAFVVITSSSSSPAWCI